MEFKELPNNIRVKLDEKAEKQLWKTVEEFGGIKKFSDEFDYSASKMYNWKAKDVFLPINFVRKILGSNATDGLTAIKGEARSKPIQNPKFPLEENEELLTRIDCSVYVNQEGVPIYQTDDRGLLNRFVQLLELYGDVLFSVYNRSRYEVRYPKYLHEILSQMSFNQDLSALVDEEGRIVEDSVVVQEQKIGVNEFEGRLYSRDKRLQLALARGDSEDVADIMAEEAGRIRGISQSQDG